MEFELKSEEGLPIRGHLDMPRDPRAVVVVAHGFKGFKDWGFFPWLGERLSASRLAAVRFNMSRSGLSHHPENFDRLDLFEHDTYSIQISDLLTTVRWVQKRLPGLPLFLLGHSRGGGVAILAAASVERLYGVITWSAISRVDRWDAATIRKWRADGTMEVVNQRTKQVLRMSTAILDDYDRNRQRLDILGAAARMVVPLLVIHGGRDESVPVEEAGLIASRAVDSSMMIIGSASHTFNAIHPLVHVPKELEYAAEVTTHFAGIYS